MKNNFDEVVNNLSKLGVLYADAVKLRRCAMTLHRWHELECGDSNGHTSYCLVRGYLEDGEFTSDENGKPYLEFSGLGKGRYQKIGDREAGAKKTLSSIMGRYPVLWYYIQTDPRGAALYVGEKNKQYAEKIKTLSIDQFYNDGVAVYK